MRVRIINPSLPELQTKRLKVCAYCRVSTGSDEQSLSLENQTSTYESIKEGVKVCKGIHVRDEDAVMQNITEPTVVKEMMINGEKHYSYTRKSEYNSHFEQSKPKKAENGCVLPSVHRQEKNSY